MKTAAVVGVGLVGISALALARETKTAAPASIDYAPADPWAVSWVPSTSPLSFDSAPLYSETIGFDPAIEYAIIESFWAPIMQPVDPLPAMETARNLDAFLAIIRAGESSDNYLALVGGGEFSSFADHPAITGEFAGIRRADDGRLSTAAGAYQITRTTWRDLGGAKKYGDFSPSAQDRAAIDLLKRRKAYEDVIAGRVELAVRKLQNEWEMFTLARWRGERVLAAFKNQGGALA